MIYDVDNGDRGRVFSNGAEVNLLIKRVDTDTGEVIHAPRPIAIRDQEVITETLILENVTVEPL